MVKNKKNQEVDHYFDHASIRLNEMEKLRQIALDSGLVEELKWGKPCYTFNGKNIILIQGFKKYAALLFFKGYLLEDSSHILVKTGPKTVIGRQVRFTDIQEITQLESVLKSYIREVIEIENKS